MYTFTRKNKVIDVNGPSHHSSPRVEVGIACPSCDLQVTVTITMNRQAALTFDLLSGPTVK